MDGLITLEVQCPYCGENTEIDVDRTVDDQEYMEDCSVCCQPMLVTIAVRNEDEVLVSVRRENE